jgi:hypothetical protein
MADDVRKDYGPAGCAEGCATRSAQMVMLVAVLAAMVARSRKGRK